MFLAFTPTTYRRKVLLHLESFKETDDKKVTTDIFHYIPLYFWKIAKSVCCAI